MERLSICRPRLARAPHAREIAGVAWAALLGSPDAGKMHQKLGSLEVGAEALVVRTGRAFALIESALALQVAASLRAVP